MLQLYRLASLYFVYTNIACFPRDYLNVIVKKQTVHNTFSFYTQTRKYRPLKWRKNVQNFAKKIRVF